MDCIKEELFVNVRTCHTHADKLENICPPPHLRKGLRLRLPDRSRRAFSPKRRNAGAQTQLALGEMKPLEFAGKRNPHLGPGFRDFAMAW